MMTNKLPTLAYRILRDFEPKEGDKFSWFEGKVVHEDTLTKEEITQAADLALSWMREK